jgi:hypothetical protein
MSSLTTTDKQILEKLFQMGSGFVINLSDRTFEEFFRDDLHVEIYSDKFKYGSGSKANRMRGFWQVADDLLVGKSIEKLLTYIDTQIVLGGLDQIGFPVELIRRGHNIAARLLGSATTKVPDARRELIAKEFEEGVKTSHHPTIKLARVIKILIASPSDVSEERDLIDEVIRDWNSAHSEATRVTLRPIRWETDATPASGARPQAIIDDQIVRDADVVIGVFWHRMGTPTGIAESGTAEEIETVRAQGKPVLLYFSEIPIPHDHDAEQFKAVKRYRQTLKENTLYWTFPTREQLRRLVTMHLARTINEFSSKPSTVGSTTKVVVHRAIYHPASDKTRGEDVTELVRTLVAERGPSFLVDTNTFGDPFVDEFKALTIDFSIGENRRTKTMPQDHICNLP